MEQAGIAETKEKELIIKRIFAASRQIVWKAWTDPGAVKQWWGPKDFAAPFIKIDLRVGGEYLYCMHSPEGKDYWSKGVFREIVPLQRIVCTDSFADEKGTIVSATYYGMGPDFPLEMLLTVAFEKFDGKTKLTLEHTGIPAGADRDNAWIGWEQSLDKLDEYLKNQIPI